MKASVNPSIPTAEKTKRVNEREVAEVPAAGMIYDVCDYREYGSGVRVRERAHSSDKTRIKIQTDGDVRE